MKTPTKLRVAVLYGGRSPEHEVSVSSATNVMKHLDPKLFEVVPIKIDKQGTWFLQSSAPAALPAPQKLFTPTWLQEPETPAISQGVERCSTAERLFDVIFPVMHGSFSEDGTIQGLLELADVPYVGSGVLASALGMDKDVARRLVNHAGIQSVPYLAIKENQWKREASTFLAQVEKSFSFPVFVKPANQGSSIGVSKVKTKEDLAAAIQKAFLFDTKILVEQGIPALELEVSVLEALEENEALFTSLACEAKPTKDEFYTYDAKYSEGGVDLIIPADIPEKIQKEVRRLSEKIFSTLSAEGMARIDFFVDRNTQEIYFNEMNTIPGFTPTSMHPQAVMASGMGFSEMLTRLIKLAMKKFERRQQLERNYIA